MNENFQDLLADTSESFLDSLIENEIIKEIPILGSSLSIIRGIKNIRDRSYLNKIKLFLEKIGKINESQKQRLIDDSLKNEKSRAKLGDAIFTTLDQCDSAVKVEYMAIAFEAYLNGEIDSYEIKLLCHIIKNNFSEELIAVVEFDSPNIQLNYLTGSGLVDVIYMPLNYDSSTEPHFQLSHSSEQLRKAWKKYNKK